MNVTSSSQRSLFFSIIALSLGFHAALLTLFILFGFLHPVTPIEDTKITMLRLASRGIPKSSAGSQSSSSTVNSSAKPTSSQNSNPAQTTQKTVKTAQPALAQAPAALKPNPRVAANAESTGPKVTSKTSDKKKTTPSAASSAPAQSPQTSPTNPNDQKIAQALSQVKQDLQTRETASAGSGTEGGSGGNNVGNNNGAAGGNIAASDPILVQYQTQVKQKIIREWVRANTGGETEVLRTRVSVRIDAGGKVVSTSFVKKSGNASFDLSTIRAVERASPLPTPPEAIKAEALSEGFVIDFNSRMLGS